LKLTNFSDDARIAFDNVLDFATGLTTPTVRLGVTGLSRSGKTVFITALLHNLIHGGRLPLFEPYAAGRIADAHLEHQPDDDVPRFDYEAHVAALLDDRVWPQSTRRISEIRLTIQYESATFLSRTLGSGKLHLDIVDYPGEWLLDLPLLTKDYATWSKEAIALSDLPNRRELATDWRSMLAGTDPAGAADEATAQALAETFRAYLIACRADAHALSTLPPGRFLMPGDMEGSPALTFAPLEAPATDRPDRDSLWSLMDRRYEAYKTHVVRPFFRNHFARLDRQIVLVDALNALNAGRDALQDLETALTEILRCFRPGRSSWLASILTRRIDRILFAATKADHLHHEGHDRLQRLMSRLVRQAIARARFAGADVDVAAMAAIRATREASAKQNGDNLPTIIGTPLPGEIVNGETFDGQTEIALFPGDLPSSPDGFFEHSNETGNADQTDLDLRFVRFQPPALERTAEGLTLSLPHIRLDRSLQFLLGDKLA